MISQVDDALREIVRTDAVDTEIDVVFDAPTKDWAARRNAPTVNLYLYDIREDLKHRASGFSERHDPQTGHVVARMPAPRFYKLSYLLTAWTQRPEDEHRLLDSLLRAFLKYDALPERLVTGPLAEPGETVKITIGLPPPEDRAFADVWSALGGELKPSLDLVVVAPMWTGRVYDVGAPVDEGLIVEARDLVHGGSDPRRQRHEPAPPSEEAAARLAARTAGAAGEAAGAVAGAAGAAAGAGPGAAGTTGTATGGAGARRGASGMTLGQRRPRGRGGA